MSWKRSESKFGHCSLRTHSSVVLVVNSLSGRLGAVDLFSPVDVLSFSGFASFKSLVELFPVQSFFNVASDVTESSMQLNFGRLV